MDFLGYVTPAEAARMLGVSKVRITQLCQEQRLTYLLSPLGKLIDKRSIDAYAQVRQRSHFIEYRNKFGLHKV